MPAVGACLAPFWEAWLRWGAEDWVTEILKEGYQIPFLSTPPLSPVPLHLPSYSPTSIRGIALASEILALQEKGAIELAPPTPGYYSRVFVAMKASGAWRPIIDLSVLNRSIVSTRFHMETPQSVLRLIRKDDWSVTLDLQDAYLQIPIHPESRKFVRFVSGGQTFQFRVLPFGLTTAPQVFTRVMAPVSSIMHRKGYRIIRYLDDWLVLGSSLEELIQARDFLLRICTVLGVRINYSKSNLVPSQCLTYLGMVIQTIPLRVFPTEERLRKLSLQLEEFRSSLSHPVQLWLSLLGRMSSLSLLIPGSRLRMRSLQLVLNQAWKSKDLEERITWDHSCRGDLQWWSDASNLTPGVPLETPLPDVFLYTDASDQGWGSTLENLQASGLWSGEEQQLSINMRELLAVHRALLHFRTQLQGLRIGLFTDNTTTVAYLRKSGGTRSSNLNNVAQDILRLCEKDKIQLFPQFLAGKLNVMADALSRSNQVLGAEWTLCEEVFLEVQHRWSVTIDLFATHLNHRLPVYFSPVRDPMSAGTDAMLQSWDGMEVYAFPPFAMIQQVLLKLRQCKRVSMTLIAPFWPQRSWFPDLLDLLVEVPFALPQRRDLLRQPHFHRHHRNLRVLSLAAWRLCSEPPAIKASLQQWLSSLHSADASPLA